MRKRNASDRMKLKTKYTNIKKRKQRKIKIKRDMKKNPNKYHKKKSDPGVPNSAPFKAAILKERDEFIKNKEDEKKKRREEILRIRQEIRDAKVAEKRKLTDVLDLGKDNDDSDKDDEGNQPIMFGKDEMNLRLKSDGNESSDDDSDASDSENDMEVDEKPRKPLDAATRLARKAKNAHFAFRTAHSNFKNNPEKSDPDSRWIHMRPDRVNYRRVKEVVEGANVILEVLDARDPLGTRCPPVEELVRNKQKKLVFVLNKADLVPKSNLEAWLRHLRSEGPAVAFKAATSRHKKMKKTVDRMRFLGEESLRTSLTMGADVLMQLLKNYARSYSTGIVVGVVGLPNVGKSSLVNSLKKVKACEVAPIPGCTKYLREIKLDAKLRMVDSPGVVLPSRDMDPVEAVLKNVVRVANVSNLVDCGLEIFKRSDSLKLALIYDIRRVEDGDEFLGALAKRYKMYTTSGIVNKEAAAKRLVYDWNHGILKYYTEPPKFTQSEVKTKIVSSLAPAFELDTVSYRKEEQFLTQFDDGRPSVTMKLAPNAPVKDIQSDEAFDIVEEEDGTVEQEKMDDE